MTTGSQKEPTLADVLAAVERIDGDIQGIRSDLATSRQELKDEVKRWDAQFFKFAEDTANRANTLIASASIAVIAGTLLLILREGSR
jgi:hypothetical protein